VFCADYVYNGATVIVDNIFNQIVNCVASTNS